MKKLVVRGMEKELRSVLAHFSFFECSHCAIAVVGFIEVLFDEHALPSEICFKMLLRKYFLCM